MSKVRVIGLDVGAESIAGAGRRIETEAFGRWGQPGSWLGRLPRRLVGGRQLKGPSRRGPFHPFQLAVYPNPVGCGVRMAQNYGYTGKCAVTGWLGVNSPPLCLVRPQWGGMSGHRSIRHSWAMPLDGFQRAASRVIPSVHGSTMHDDE